MTNAVTCLICLTTIRSEHRHDFRSCKCPPETQVSVDGGPDYKRRAYSEKSLFIECGDYRFVDPSDVGRTFYEGREGGLIEGTIVSVTNVGQTPHPPEDPSELRDAYFATVRYADGEPVPGRQRYAFTKRAARMIWLRDLREWIALQEAERARFLLDSDNGITECRAWQAEVEAKLWERDEEAPILTPPETPQR